MKAREIAFVELLPAAARTSTTNGTGADLQDYTETQGHEFAVVLNVGAAAAGTLDVKLQESDVSGSGYADISGAAFTQVATTPGQQVIYVKTRKRYLRAVGTQASTPNHTYAVLAALTKRRV